MLGIQRERIVWMMSKKYLRHRFVVIDVVELMTCEEAVDWPATALAGNLTGGIGTFEITLIMSTVFFNILTAASMSWVAISLRVDRRLVRIEPGEGNDRRKVSDRIEDYSLSVCIGMELGNCLYSQFLGGLTIPQAPVQRKHVFCMRRTTWVGEEQDNGEMIEHEEEVMKPGGNGSQTRKNKQKRKEKKTERLLKGLASSSSCPYPAVLLCSPPDLPSSTPALPSSPPLLLSSSPPRLSSPLLHYTRSRIHATTPPLIPSASPLPYLCTPTSST
eukprot:759745-Hanusia_phi.AAC.2